MFRVHLTVVIVALLLVGQGCSDAGTENQDVGSEGEVLTPATFSQDASPTESLSATPSQPVEKEPPTAASKKCKPCEGTGNVTKRCPLCKGGRKGQDGEDCRTCAGLGIIFPICRDCGGRGWL